MLRDYNDATKNPMGFGTVAGRVVALEPTDLNEPSGVRWDRSIDARSSTTSDLPNVDTFRARYAGTVLALF